MMPFIVTTKRPRVGGRRPFVLSCRAVATLEEMRRSVALQEVGQARGRSSNWNEFYEAALSMPESGGSVGPLPDGTVIEVEPIGLARLRTDCGAPEGYMTSDEIIAAYNAKQEAE